MGKADVVVKHEVKKHSLLPQSEKREMHACL